MPLCPVAYKHSQEKGVTMLFWEIRDEDGKCLGTELDFGNAAELHMILCEMNPEKKLSMVEVDEVKGA